MHNTTLSQRVAKIALLWCGVLASACAGLVPDRAEDPDKPAAGAIDGQITVNNGSAFAKTQTIDIRVVLGAFATHVAVVESTAELAQVEIPAEAFVTSLTSFTLSPGDGEKRLFFQFRDLGDHRSAVGQWNVVLDTSPPACELVALCRTDLDHVRWGFDASWQAPGTCPDQTPSASGWCRLDPMCAPYDQAAYPVAFTGVFPNVYTSARNLDAYVTCDPGENTDWVQLVVIEDAGDVVSVPVSYSDYFSYTLDNEGEVLLALRFVDLAGNETESAPVHFVLDQQPPQAPRVLTLPVTLNTVAEAAFRLGDDPPQCPVGDTSVADESACQAQGFDDCQEEAGACVYALALAIDRPSLLEAEFGCYEIRGGDSYPDYACAAEHGTPPDSALTPTSIAIALRGNAPNSLRVRSRDRAGNVSSDDLVVVVEDSVAPPRPENVTASPENGAALVEWQHPTESQEDVAGYKLYYGTVSGQLTGNFSQNGPSPVDVGLVTSFRLSGLQNNTDVFIALESYDHTNIPGPNHSVRTKELRIRPNETNPQLDKVYSYAVQDLLYDSTTDVLFASMGDATLMAVGADYPEQTTFAEEPVWSLAPGLGFGSQMALDRGRLYVAGGPLGLVTFCSDLAGFVGYQTYGDWAAADVYPIASTAITHLAVASDVTGTTLAYLGSRNGMQIVDIVPPDCGQGAVLTPRDPYIYLRLFGGRRIDAVASLPPDSTLGVPVVGVVADGGWVTLFFDLHTSPNFSILGPFSCINANAEPCNWSGIALTDPWLILLSPDPFSGLGLYNLQQLLGYTWSEADLGIPDLKSGSLRTLAARFDPVRNETDLVLVGESDADPGVGLLSQFVVTDDGTGMPELTGVSMAWSSEIPRSVVIGRDKIYANLSHYGIQPMARADIGTLDAAERIPVDVGGPASSSRVVWQNGLCITAEGSGGVSAIEDEDTTVDDIYDGFRFEWQVMSPLYDQSVPALIPGLDADLAAQKNQVNDIELVGDTLFVAEDRGIQVFDARPWQDRLLTTQVGQAAYTLHPGPNRPVLELEIQDAQLLAVLGPADAAALVRYDLAPFFAGQGLFDADLWPGWPVDLSGLGQVAPRSLLVSDRLAYFLSRDVPEEDPTGAPSAGFIHTIAIDNPSERSSCEYNDPGRPVDLALAGYEAYIVDELGALHYNLPGHYDKVRSGLAATVGPYCDDGINDGLFGFVPQNGAGTAVRLAGPLAYVTTTLGLELLDFGSEGRLGKSGWLEAPLGAFDTAFDGTRLLLAGGRSGLLRMNLETRGKISPWRAATVLGGVGKKVALGGRFAFLIDDEANVSSYNYQLVVVDLSDSPLSPLWSAVGLPSYFALGSGDPEVKFLDVDVYRNTLRLVKQRPAPGGHELLIETYSIDAGFELLPLAATTPVPVTGLLQVLASFDERYVYLTVQDNDGAKLRLYDLGDPTPSLTPTPIAIVDLAAFLPPGAPSWISELGESAPVFNNTIYYSDWRGPDPSAVPSQGSDWYSEITQIDVGRLIAGYAQSASDIRRTPTELFYEQLAIQQDRGVLIGSSRLVQRLGLFGLDADDSPARGDERYPTPWCTVDTLYAGVLNATGRSIYTAMMVKGPNDRPISVGMQLFDLSFPDPLDRDAWPLGRLDPNDETSPPAPTGEFEPCPPHVVRPSNFIDRGGFDIAVEGPFVYLANERGLDVIDLR